MICLHILFCFLFCLFVCFSQYCFIFVFFCDCFFFYLQYHKNEWQHKPIQYRRVCRYQNGQRKRTKGQKTKDWVTTTPLKHPGDIRCSGRVISSCSTSGIRRVAPVSIPVIRHDWGKDRELHTTIGKYQWSFDTHVFRNSKVHLLDYQTILERRPTKLWINDIPNDKTAS